MNRLELMVLASTPRLAESLARLEGVDVITAPTPQRALSLIDSPSAPDALYVEDTFRGTVSDLWSVIRAAQARSLPVLVNLQGPAADRVADFRAAGVTLLDARAVDQIIGLVAGALGVRARAFANSLLIAIAGVKGGIGKTTVIRLLAEALRLRGARVLVVDSDMSNSGLRPTFHLPSTAPTYTSLLDDQLGMAAWTVERVRSCIYRHEASGLDFLLGPEELRGSRDLDRANWYSFFQVVRQLEGYDVVLFDTPPEIMKRPVPYIVAREGGWVVLPAPCRVKERVGVLNLLRALKGNEGEPDLTERALLVGMEPEKGVIEKLSDALPLFAREAPNARLLGTMVRDPRLISLAETYDKGYLSPLAIAPHGKFAHSVHDITDGLAQAVGLPLPHPKPKSTFIDKLFRAKPKLPELPPASTASSSTREVAA